LPALELGARLGATSAVALNLRNPDFVEVSDALALFVEMAAQCGLGVNIEPVAICQTATLAQARELIRMAGVDAGIVLDLYHLVRANGTAADIRAMEPELIRHVQINDGVAAPSRETLFIEAARERPYPGEGVFPLVELLSAVPTTISWGIEAPSLRRNESGMSAQRQAQEAMAAIRRVLQKIDAVG
jgi:sugar phosphate isomerase/epimerase